MPILVDFGQGTVMLFANFSPFSLGKVMLHANFSRF